MLTLMNVIVNNEVNSKKDEAIDDIWEKWTCKMNTINKFVNLILIDKI